MSSEELEKEIEDLVEYFTDDPPKFGDTRQTYLRRIYAALLKAQKKDDAVNSFLDCLSFECNGCLCSHHKKDINRIRDFLYDRIK